jgi:hypothetical protein
MLPVVLGVTIVVAADLVDLPEFPSEEAALGCFEA